MSSPAVAIYAPDKPTTIKGRKMVAKANLIVEHNRINAIKVMQCPERGLLCWCPAHVEISMECRELILGAVREKGLA